MQILCAHITFNHGVVWCIFSSCTTCTINPIQELEHVMYRKEIIPLYLHCILQSTLSDTLDNHLKLLFFFLNKNSLTSDNQFVQLPYSSPLLHCGNINICIFEPQFKKSKAYCLMYTTGLQSRFSSDTVKIYCRQR